MAIIVTGVADFFRSNFVLDWFNTSDEAVANRDKLTCTLNPHNLDCLHFDVRSTSVRGDTFDFNYFL
jgi:dTDP-glucose 4,6-dehydratase